MSTGCKLAGTVDFQRQGCMAQALNGRLHACAGRIVNERALRQRVFCSGVEPDVRREAWKFLLGFYPMDSTATERAALLRAQQRQYGQLKAQWTSITPQQAARCVVGAAFIGCLSPPLRRQCCDVPGCACEAWGTRCCRCPQLLSGSTVRSGLLGAPCVLPSLLLADGQASAGLRPGFHERRRCREQEECAA